ncbi:P-II family nitrogen regulator [Rhizobium aegyptiacum]|uniref:P-II family nitrogen regulator n=1 Tax=Rhizobium aegyptiacum TaxID=1764550 RepID=UPI0007E54DBF|nr:P-II family nitrogen regulator [Rhizobium aegyptiacum]
MIKIEAFVPPFSLFDIRELLRVFAVDDLLVTEAKELTAPAGIRGVYRGVECSVDAVPILKMEFVLRERDQAEVIAALRLILTRSPRGAMILASSLQAVVPVPQNLARPVREECEQAAARETTRQ